MIKQRKCLVSADMLEAIVNREDPLFALVSDLEAPIQELRNRAHILYRVCTDMDEGDGMAVLQIGRDVEANAETLTDIRRQLFRLTHPDPAIRAKGKRSA